MYGPQTVAAVEQLQTDSGLPVTGFVDEATARALQDKLDAVGGRAQEATQTAALQTILTLTGFWDGPIDGQWTDALTQALMAMQTALGVEPTGVRSTRRPLPPSSRRAPRWATPAPSGNSRHRNLDSHRNHDCHRYRNHDRHRDDDGDGGDDRPNRTAHDNRLTGPGNLTALLNPRLALVGPTSARWSTMSNWAGLAGHTPGRPEPRRPQGARGPARRRTVRVRARGGN